jgi:hypothetical protein
MSVIRLDAAAAARRLPGTGQWVSACEMMFDFIGNLNTGIQAYFIHRARLQA